MRIGVVTASYPRHPGDAAGSFVGAHVAALRASGHDVEVIGAHTIASELFERGGAPDELERGGLRAHVAAASFTARLAAAAVRRAGAWDLAVAHWLVPSALALLPSRTPLLAIAHGGDVHTLRRMHLLAPMLRVLERRRARLAFVSEELRQIARAAAPRLDRYVDDSLVQPMGLDVARFTALRTREPSRRTTPRIVVVARLVPVKGVDTLLAAHRLLRTQVELVIAGDGPERARLESLARDAATRASIETAPARVTFLGAVDAASRDDLLRSATLVVVPSRVLPNGRSEGTPMIALEALAAGVPVVASAVGGLRDLAGITHVRPDDPLALAAAIDRTLSADAHAPVDVAHLDWSHVSEHLLAHALCRVSPAICATGDTSSRRSA
jgi:glycosyltransferase involved in cell wall biosynthesis